MGRVRRPGWKMCFTALALAIAMAVTGYYLLRPVRRSARPAGFSLSHAIARAKTLLQNGRPDEALRIVSFVSETGDGAAELLLVKGMALVARGQTEAGRQALERSLKLNSAQPMAAKVLAAIAFDRGDEQKGIHYLSWAASLDPHDFRPWYALGDAHLRFGHAGEAVDAFRAALELKPDHEESKEGLLAGLLASRPAEESAALVKELLERDPDSPRVRTLAARQALNTGDADAAMRHARKAIELDPNGAEALLIRAQLHRMAGELPDALADAEHAVKAEPAHAPAFALLAQLQAAMGQLEESRVTQGRHNTLVSLSERIQKLREELARNPKDPMAYCRLGQTAAELGATRLAAENFRAALELDPILKPALVGLETIERPTASTTRDH